MTCHRVEFLPRRAFLKERCCSSGMLRALVGHARPETSRMGMVLLGLCWYRLRDV